MPGVFRSRTNEFLSLRKNSRFLLDQQLTQSLQIISEISITRLEEEQKAKPKSKTPQKKPEKSPFCVICRAPFGWRLSRYTCQHCKLSVCKECSRDTLPKTLSKKSNSQKPVKACERCFNHIDMYYRRLRYQERKAQAQNNPLSICQEDSLSLRNQIVSLITRYVDTVSAITLADLTAPSRPFLPSSTSLPSLNKQISFSTHNKSIESIDPRIALYQTASQIEQELQVALSTFEKCTVDIDDTLKPSTPDELLFLANFKQNTSLHLSEFKSTITSLRKRILESEMKPVEKTYKELRGLYFELCSRSALVGAGAVVAVAVDRVLAAIRTDLSSRVEGLQLDLAEFLPSLAKSNDEKNPPEASPSPSPSYDIIHGLQKALAIVERLACEMECSVSRDYYPNAMSALRGLVQSLQVVVRQHENTRNDFYPALKPSPLNSALARAQSAASARSARPR